MNYEPTIPLFRTFIKYNIMVIYRVDYEQKRINEQITVPKHTWKVMANATPIVQMMEKNTTIK